MLPTFQGTDIDTSSDVTARVTYKASGVSDDLPAATPFDTWPDFDDTALVPIEPEPEHSATAFHRLDAYFDTFDDGSNRASFNNMLVLFCSSYPLVILNLGCCFLIALTYRQKSLQLSPL